jgi:hypothetical protein
MSDIIKEHNGIIIPANDIPETKPVTQTPNTIKVLKNVLLCNVADSTGCGNLRAVFPFTYLNAVFGKKGNICPILTHTFIKQHEVLVRTKTAWFQRQMSKQHYDIMKQYADVKNNYKFKIIYDLDDYLWGKNEKQGGDKFDGIPSYNFAWEVISDELKTWSIKIMEDLADIITVSTRPLADEIQKLSSKKLDIRILENAVPKYLYGDPERRPNKTETIKKPRVVFAGAAGHYAGIGTEKKAKGDFEGAWYDWVLKSIKEDSIEFIVMGGMPWFFEGIKDKIQVINWLNAFQYPFVFKGLRPDFVIMPLVPNKFNSCKSNIKYLETCAIGAVGIGTRTGNFISPYDKCEVTVNYDCTVEDIERTIRKYCEPEYYNDALKKQYDMMERDGRYVESSKYVNYLANLLFS